MIELVLAAWSASAVLLFLPVGATARLIGRRLRSPAPVGAGPAAADSADAAPPPAPSPTGTAEENPPAEPGSSDSGTQPAEPPAATTDEREAAAAPAGSADTAPSEEAPPGVAASADSGPNEEKAPAGPVEPSPARRPVAQALGLLRRLATVALFGVFIAGAIYLTPRLLARALDTEHPMAAITSQSMYPALKRGDLVLIQGVDKAADLGVGDIIAFENEDGFAIHRLVRIDGETMVTQGDANLSEDEPITFDHVIGRALTFGGRVARIPYLGNVPLVFGRTSDEDAGPAESPPLYEGQSEDESEASASD